MSNKYPLLGEKEQTVLQDTLLYMKMAELRHACGMLGLPDKGKKTLLIDRILTRIKTGDIVTSPKVPSKSLARNHPVQQLNTSSLMLYGEYKNDAKTREFFKALIGPHFHFTAFGIDWLNERWLAGNPPTYQEYADFWVKETARRKKEGAKPKDEWMFIRFMQMMEKEYPDLAQEQVLDAWKTLQAQKKQEAFQLLNKVIKNV